MDSFYHEIEVSAEKGTSVTQRGVEGGGVSGPMAHGF